MNANKTCFHAHVRLRSTVSSLQTYKMGATVKTESDEFSVSQQKIINSLQISTSSTAESHSYHCNVYYLVLGTQNLENAPPHSKLLAPIQSCGTCHYCRASRTSACQWNVSACLFGEFLRHKWTPTASQPAIRKCRASLKWFYTADMDDFHIGDVKVTCLACGSQLFICAECVGARRRHCDPSNVKQHDWQPRTACFFLCSAVVVGVAAYAAEQTSQTSTNCTRQTI